MAEESKEASAVDAVVSAVDRLRVNLIEVSSAHESEESLRNSEIETRLSPTEPIETRTGPAQLWHEMTPDDRFVTILFLILVLLCREYVWDGFQIFLTFVCVLVVGVVGGLFFPVAVGGIFFSSYVLLIVRVIMGPVIYEQFQILYDPKFDNLQILRSPRIVVSPWEERWRDRWIDKFEGRLLDSSSCLGCLI
jgi:hypothetical protein